MINSNGSTAIKSFYDKHYEKQIVFPSNQIDAVIGFFTKRGFAEQAAKSTGITLLTQAYIENVNPFELIDKLKGMSDVQLSQVVTQVLNTSRSKTSALGYKQIITDETTESRNIVA